MTEQLNDSNPDEGAFCTLPDHVGPLLATFTTMRVGGPIKKLLVAGSEADLIRYVSEADEAGEKVLLVGGGSNMLVADEGFDGTVIVIANRGISSDTSGCTGALVDVAAGEPWDTFVAHTIAREWVGLECLSGIPGLVGATPIQNVGAYGTDVSATITRVRTWDRKDKAVRTFVSDECQFAYRMSRFKADLDRYVVLSVSFQFPLGTLSAPVQYAELAKKLGVEIGQRADAAAVRQAVLELRQGKGMVLDPADHDTWSAGSFFTNPIITAEQADKLPADAPRYPAGDGLVKTSAAWLIDHAGFHKGHGAGRPASVSTKHALALTNRGKARTADIVALAREIRAGVEQAYGITLVPEPVFVGVDL